MSENKSNRHKYRRPVTKETLKTVAVGSRLWWDECDTEGIVTWIEPSGEGCYLSIGMGEHPYVKWYDLSFPPEEEPKLTTQVMTFPEGTEVIVYCATETCRTVLARYMKAPYTTGWQSCPKCGTQNALITATWSE